MVTSTWQLRKNDARERDLETIRIYLIQHGLPSKVTDALEFALRRLAMGIKKEEEEEKRHAKAQPSNSSPDSST